jgi:hypothetical protein
VRRAKLIATAAVAVAALGLSACSSNAGQAAVVGGHRISETTVANYLDPKGPNASALANIASSGGTFQPRSEALTDLIRAEIFAVALARTPGGEPSATQLAAVHDAVATSQFQSQVTGTKFDKALSAQVTALGFRSSFTKVLVRGGELEYLFIQRTKPKKNADLIVELKKLGVTVTTSPRYGKWNAAQLTLGETPEAGLPGFVTFATSAPAATAVPATG